jgi:hypothetical protein
MSYSGPRQISPNTGYYITIADVRNKIFSYNPTAGSQTFSAAVWTSTGTTSSLVQAAGAVLRDMGKTVVSSNRTFRKVQAVTATASTFGVGGPAVGGTVAYTPVGEDYLSGYIELGFPSLNSGIALVAAYGR